MKKYLSVFRIRLINNIQYRTVTFGAVASNIVWVLLELMMYVALYNSAGHVLPMTFSCTAYDVFSNCLIRLGKKNCNEYARCSCV